MTIQTIRTILTIFGAIISFVVIPYYFDYSDFSWDANSSNYIGFVTGIALIISNLGSNYIDSKKKTSVTKNS